MNNKYDISYQNVPTLRWIELIKNSYCENINALKSKTITLLSNINIPNISFSPVFKTKQN